MRAQKTAKNQSGSRGAYRIEALPFRITSRLRALRDPRDRATTVTDWRPRILGLGGTTRERSSSERALRHAVDTAERMGASVEVLAAADLVLPPYAPERHLDERARRLIELVERADCVIIATPGFHGGLSGLIKNALDYMEELRTHDAPYLDGRAVGCIVCAAGWQATVTTLVSLRSTVHALRGWPTPLGVAINSAQAVGTVDPVAAAAPQLELLAKQVVQFARWRHLADLSRDRAGAEA
jgi:FMN reductase